MDDREEPVESRQPTSEEEYYDDTDDTDDTDSYGSDTHEQSRVDADHEVGAPRYVVPARAMGAVEVPMVVANLDRATRAFGNVPDFKLLLDPNRNSLPLYMDPDNAFCPSILSHNASTHNVLLKVTVPKRTGRKRKRGSDGPWEGDVEVANAAAPAERVASVRRADHPKTLLRKLQDNVDDYKVETVGVIKHTHRYRGLMDFQVNLGKSDFSTNFVEKVLSGDVEKMKQFTIKPGIDAHPNADIIPPPKFTHMTLPFSYAYEQNPFVHAVRGAQGEEQIVNKTAPALVGSFIAATDPTPMAPHTLPNLLDPLTAEVLSAVEEAFEVRPIWTRRSLLNHLGPRLKNWGPLKRFLGYAAYQFKGGPWRDALMPYGLDPRTDPKYRVYQTLSFKLPNLKSAKSKKSWKNFRRARDADPYKYEEDTAESHIFNGDTYYSNGKVWQVCDITDPALARMFAEARVRGECDIDSSGWFHQGLWGKAKAVMKCKLVAVLFNRTLAPDAFDHLLHRDDDGQEEEEEPPPAEDEQQTGGLRYARSTSLTPPPGAIVSLRLPDLRLTNEEIRFLKGRRIRSTGRRKNEKKKFVSVQLTRRPNKPASFAPGTATSATASVTASAAATPAPVVSAPAPARGADVHKGTASLGPPEPRGGGADALAEPAAPKVVDAHDLPTRVPDEEEQEDEDEEIDDEDEDEDEDEDAEGEEFDGDDPYGYLDDDDGVEYIYDDD